MVLCDLSVHARHLVPHAAVSIIESLLMRMSKRTTGLIIHVVLYYIHTNSALKHMSAHSTYCIHR